MKAPPEEVKLSREDGETLIARIRTYSLADDDQGLLIKLIRPLFLVYVRPERDENQLETPEAGAVWGWPTAALTAHRRRVVGRHLS